MARTTRQVTSDPASTTEPAAASTRVATRTTARDREPEHKTYVLDTSVLLSDPRAMLRFAEHEVVLPVVVVTELAGKRHHPELGYFARQAMRLLDDLRIQEARLDRPVPVGPQILPAGFRLGDNDTRILSVAKHLSAEGFDVTLVSKDLPMRVKASAVGLDAEEYRAELAVDSGWTGMAELDVTTVEMDALYEHGRIENAAAAEMPCHTGLVLLSPRGSGLGRVGADKQIRLVRGDRDAF